MFFRSKHIAGLFVSAIFVLSVNVTNAAEFFVSSEGNDANPGTKEKPFRTIEKARDTIREMQGTSRAENFTVNLRGGTYFLDDTIVFGLKDGGIDGSFVTYKSFDNEKAVLSSERKITGWQKLDTLPGNFPSELSGKLWVADMPRYKGKPAKFFTLYHYDTELGKGKSDNLKRACSHESWIYGKPEGYEGKWDQYRNFSVDRRTIAHPFNTKDIEICLTPYHQWAFNRLTFDNFDEKTGTVTTDICGTYYLSRYAKLKNACYFENVIDYLDQPGEWVFDSAFGKIYLWPKGDRITGEYGASILREYIRVEGKIDIKGDDTPVKNIRFENLAFVHGNGHLWDKDTAGIQHDFEAYDTDSCMLRFRGAENCEVIDCSFTDSDAGAIRLDLYAQNNRIVGNTIDNVGTTGIFLCGYGPGLKDVSKNNLVQNNYIRRPGQFLFTGHGIYVYQSGYNHIANNVVFETPYTGIGIGGIRYTEWNRSIRKTSVRLWETEDTLKQAKSDYRAITDPMKTDDFIQRKLIKYLHSVGNIIEYNDIFNCMTTLGDGNPIYISGTGPNNIIRCNYVHDGLCAHHGLGIRPDDLQYDTTISENIIENIAPGGIAAKHTNNHYINNIILNMRRNSAVYSTYMYLARGPVTDSIVEKNIFYHEPVKNELNLPDFIREKKKGKLSATLKVVKQGNNIFFMKNHPEVAQAQINDLKKRGILNGNIAADPMFKNIKNHDFSFLPGSPALELGIKELDFQKIGLTGKYRIQHANTMRTIISPNGAYIEGKAEKVTIRSSCKEAEIYYTLDGSEPTENSLRFTKPFYISESCIVRAKSYAKDENDLYGTMASFHEFLDSIGESWQENFDDVPYDNLPTNYFSPQGNIKIVDGGLNGTRCIQITDGKKEHPVKYYPYFYTNRKILSDFYELVFYINTNAGNNVHVELRDWNNNPYSVVADFDIKSPQISDSVEGAAINFPDNEWVKVRVRVNMKDQKWKLEASTKDKQLGEFPESNLNSKNCTQTTWIGFLSYAEGEKNTYKADSLSVKSIKESEYNK